MLPLTLLATALATTCHALSAPPLRQRSAAIERSRISLLRVGDSSTPSFGKQNAPVTLVEASATKNGAIIKTLKLSGVTAFAASATGNGGATLTPNLDLSSVSFVGISSQPLTTSARALGPVDAVVVNVHYNSGNATYATVARGAVTTASGAPISASPLATVDGGYYLAFANAGSSISWFSGVGGTHADPITFGLADCSFLAPRVLDGPAQLVFWASGRGCGGGVGLMSTKESQPNSPSSYVMHAGAFTGTYGDASISDDVRPSGWAIVIASKPIGRLTFPSLDEETDAPIGDAISIFVSDSSSTYGGIWRFQHNTASFDSGDKPWCKPKNGVSSITTVGASIVWLDSDGKRVWKAIASDESCKPRELSALSLSMTNSSYTSVTFMLSSGKLWKEDESTGTAAVDNGDVATSAEL